MQLRLNNTFVSPAAQHIASFGERNLSRAITKLCKTNFLVFQKVELGFRLGPQHKIWDAHLKQEEDVIELAPRDHGKSYSLAIAYALWNAKYVDHVKDILILGADQASAVETLDKLKVLLETKPTLSQLKPPLSRIDQQYSRTEIRLSNRKTIKAKGYNSPIRGRHPQLVILDDVLNEKNSLDPTNRKIVEDRFWQVVYPLKDKGFQDDGISSKIVVIGTTQHIDDLYHVLLNNPSFIGSKLQAIVDEETKHVLWGERYSYEDLMKIKAAMGSLSFMKEYQNTPISDETSLFPSFLFEPLKDTDLSYQLNYLGTNPVYLGADFSVPGSADGDYTAVVVFMLDGEDIILLDVWRDKPKTMKEQLDKIEYMSKMFNITYGMMEDNSFQKLYANEMANKALSLTGNTVTRSNKNSYEYGILSFRPLLENKRIVFPYKTTEDKTKTDQMIMEFSGITQRNGKIGNESYHDDVAMAFWHALCASRASTFKVSWD